MRKKNDDLKDILMTCAQKIECEEGVDAINIRRLAAETNISVGTVYNYFENKRDVLLSLTEDYWTKALVDMERCVTNERFSDQLAQMIDFLRSKMNDCAEILMRSLHDEAETGRNRMETLQKRMRNSLVSRLQNDGDIRSDVWKDPLTIESFSDFVLGNLLILLQHMDRSDGPFLEIVKRILY